MPLPLLDQGDTFLRAWHARYPGATASVFARMRDDAGRSSYDGLADVGAEAGPEGAVLDLACGDGYLLALLGARPDAPGIRVGLDMSPDELACARARLGEAAALHLGHASALPFPDGSFDAVTCHMALMLMGEVDAALAEVARVLRPGGVFSAVVGAEGRNPVFQAYLIALRAITAVERPPPLVLGDPRTREEAGLRALFSGEAWASPLHAEARVVTFTGSADAVWPFVAQMYNPDRLSDTGRAALEAETRTAWEALKNPDGTLTIGMGVRQITARRAPQRGTPGSAGG